MESIKVYHFQISCILVFQNIDFLTNFFLITVILISLIIRGIVIPLNRGIKYNFLFPFNFIPTALLGLSLDILKSPFYILGAVIGFLNLYSSKKIYFLTKNIILYFILNMDRNLQVLGIDLIHINQFYENIIIK